MALNKPVVGMAGSALTAGASTTTTTTTTAVPQTGEPSGEPIPTTPPAGYQQLFADDFTSTALGPDWHRYSGNTFGCSNRTCATTWDPSHVVEGGGLLSLEAYGGVEGGAALWLNVNGASDPTYGEYLVRSRVSGLGVTQVMTLYSDGTWPPEIDWNESQRHQRIQRARVVQRFGRPDPHRRWAERGGPDPVAHLGIITTPSTITYTVDGNVWASMPNYVTTPTHLTLQQMLWPASDPYEQATGPIPPASEVDLQVDWVVVRSSI